jgi:hypothetical protein
MKTTRLSTKGRVILPKATETPEGVPLRPQSRFRETRLEDVAGCLEYTGTPKTISQMEQGVVLHLKKRQASGRY